MHWAYEGASVGPQVLRQTRRPSRDLPCCPDWATRKRKPARLCARHVEWSSEVTATVVLVASGYPGKFESGKRIEGLDEAGRLEGVRIFHAGTREQDGKIYTSGGRILNVTARGKTLSQALDRAYAAAEMIRFDGKDYRRDIGRKGLAKER